MFDPQEAVSPFLTSEEKGQMKITLFKIFDKLVSKSFQKKDHLQYSRSTNQTFF